MRKKTQFRPFVYMVFTGEIVIAGFSQLAASPRYSCVAGLIELRVLGRASISTWPGGFPENREK